MSNIIVSGNTNNPSILVVAEPPSERAYQSGQVMSPACMRIFQTQAIACGFGQTDFCFITPCKDIPVEASTDSRINTFIDAQRGEFLATFTPLSEKCKLIVYLGKWAGRQVMGTSIKITEVRGQMRLHDSLPVPVLPLLSPGNVLRRPEQAEIFQTDCKVMETFRRGGWNMEGFANTRCAGKYRWCLDLENEINLDNPPKGMALDVEWRVPSRSPLTIQLSWKDGEAVALPMDMEYWNKPELRGESNKHLPLMTPRMRMKLVHQLRTLCANPNVAFTGHMFKEDLLTLKTIKVFVKNWLHDTVQLAFVVDDNMQNKQLSECVRRWLPAMAGYSDEFDRIVDKSHMETVPHDAMLNYGGGDVDCSRQLCRKLVPLAKEDRGNYRCYERIQMPALRTFFVTEQTGLKMDRTALGELAIVAKRQTEQLRESLLQRVSGKLKRRMLDDERSKGQTPDEILDFGRSEFLLAVLFGDKASGGLGLKPRVFTASTMKLPPAERVPSTSSKDHLPYFDHLPFVRDLIDYKKLSKLTSTYIGLPEHSEFVGVSLLKSGKAYQKAAQDILNSYEFEFEFLPRVDGEPNGCRYELEKDGKTLLIDNSGRPWYKSVIEATGFWKYLDKDSLIHPSYVLHRTVTGRSASQNPNGQNIPKRGSTPMMKELVSAYRRCFVAKEGCKFIEVDLSQAELRLAAWMSNDETMLGIYRDGGDIHASTAARSMGLSMEQFMALPDDDRKMARFRAKAVNFGFLYGMWWKGFMSYAKTEYGIDLTEKEAEAAYSTFFALYSGLQGWHKGMKAFAQSKGYVRALHGALRRLPSVNSDDEGVISGTLRQAINSPIQRFASDLALIGKTRFVADCPIERVWPAGFIHDSVVLEVREQYAEEMARAAKWYMQTPPLMEWFGIECPIPLLADVAIGDNLNDMEERHDLEAVRPVWAKS